MSTDAERARERTTLVPAGHREVGGRKGDGGERRQREGGEVARRAHTGGPDATCHPTPFTRPGRGKGKRATITGPDNNNHANDKNNNNSNAAAAERRAALAVKQRANRARRGTIIPPHRRGAAPAAASAQRHGSIPAPMDAAVKA